MENVMRLIAILLTLSLFSTSAFAITFGEGERPDPILEGSKCDHPELMSYGGYVYSWPSKFDFVFEPFVSWFVRCPDSGFVSLAKDFETLSESDIEKVRDYLAEHPWKNNKGEEPYLQEMLDHMEGIYNVRDLSREDRAYFFRARAWHYQDNPNADLYRQKALEIHKEILEDEELEGFELIANLYIAGFYTWKLGEPAEGEKYFQRALAVEWVDDEGQNVTGSDYISELISEIKDGKADDDVRFELNEPD